MLEKLRQELQDELENVLQNTISYGIAPDRIGEVSLSAVAETLVIREKWNWITKYEIEETVTLTSDYTLSNNRISKKQGLSFPELPDYPGVPGEFVRGFFGASEETAEKISKREILEDSMFLRFVTDVDSAGLIAIYHTGFDGTTPDLISSILCLDVQLALQEGAVIKQAPSEFILGKSLKPRHFSQLE